MSGGGIISCVDISASIKTYISILTVGSCWSCGSGGLWSGLVWETWRNLLGTIVVTHQVGRK